MSSVEEARREYLKEKHYSEAQEELEQRNKTTAYFKKEAAKLRRQRKYGKYFKAAKTVGKGVTSTATFIGSGVKKAATGFNNYAKNYAAKQQRIKEYNKKHKITPMSVEQLFLQGSTKKSVGKRKKGGSAYTGMRSEVSDLLKM